MIFECAEASLVAYDDAETVEAFAKDRGYDKWYLFSKDDHQCIVLKGEKDIVAFRGTEFSDLVFADLLTNLNSGQRKAVGRGNVHRGYYRAFFTLWPLIRHLVKRPIFTGHSMGAAIATIAGATVPCEAVYSFCSPKVGDQEFADNYPSQMYRFVCPGDRVLWYPTDTPDWKHVGNPITLDSKQGHSMQGVVDVLK